MAIGVAYKAFFAALFNPEVSKRLGAALTEDAAGVPAIPEQKLEKPQEKKEKAPLRSDALTLLGTLQREARLVDLIQEPLEGFEDAQVGAAAREVLRDSRKTLDRLLAIEAVSEAEEGESIQIGPGESPNRLSVSGDASQNSGVVTHRGWKATRCDLPNWNGDRKDAWVLAPVQVDASK